MANNPRRTNGSRRNRIRDRWKHQQAACNICGQPIDYTLKNPDPYAFVVDEIIPITHGGNPYDYDNTAPAHRWCNRIKSTHSLQWARRKVAAMIRNGEQPKPTRHQREHITSSSWF